MKMAATTARSTILDAVQVLYDNNVSRFESNRSNVTVLTGDRKKITKKVHEKSGKEEEEPEFNKADDCNVLLVVDKGVGKEEIEA